MITRRTIQAGPGAKDPGNLCVHNLNLSGANASVESRSGSSPFAQCMRAPCSILHLGRRSGT